MVHPAPVLLPLLRQRLDPGPGVEGAVAVGNDPAPLHLLIQGCILLHPADCDGVGVESVRVAGQDQRLVFLFSGHVDIRGLWNGIMVEFMHGIPWEWHWGELCPWNSH